ncbi:DMT family transporter [Clostridium sp. 'deep sea']|uniref:DMT family transporter n=1 Tax=Clostridium sp. 'deep sea' TaxID=2779445 RepID=UPI0018967C2A|nr:DMT family transporter [Clostridium sp. 'deep sea']QOR34060.1 DMT family transporter [Clostridium sp. 'deep sea']
MKAKSDNKNVAILFMILAAFLFTVMQLFIKLTPRIPVFEKLFFRNSIGLLITFFLLKKNNVSVLGKKENRKLLVLRGCFGVGGGIAYFISVTNLPMADASIIYNLNPFFVTLFAVLCLKEKLKKPQIAALLITFFGALLVIKPQFSADTIPALIGFVGSIFMGAAYTVLRQLKGKEHPSTAVFYFCLFSTLASIPFMFFNYKVPNRWEILTLISIGFFSVAGQFALTYAYKNAPASEVSIFNYTSIIMSVIFGALVWHEFPDFLTLLGAFIIVGVAVTLYVSERVANKKLKGVNHISS